MKTAFICTASIVALTTATYALTTINGTPQDDLLTGTSAQETLIGGDGDDQIWGGHEGFAPGDTIYGDEGSDTLGGGEGHDTIHGGNGPDLMYGSWGNDQVNGNNGNDTMYGGGNEDTLYGGDGSDFIHDIGGTNHIYGDNGADRITTGAGADYIWTGTDLSGQGGSLTLRNRIHLRSYYAEIDSVGATRSPVLIYSNDTRGQYYVTWAGMTDVVLTDGVTIVSQTQHDALGCDNNANKTWTVLLSTGANIFHRCTNARSVHVPRAINNVWPNFPNP